MAELQRYDTTSNTAQLDIVGVQDTTEPDTHLDGFVFTAAVKTIETVGK